MEFNAIDLFAGCGGLSLGLSAAGFNVVYANEVNKTAAETYSENLIKRKKHNTYMDVRDIRTVSTSEILELAKTKKIDLVAGGPPCQGFSMAGKRDINDPRSTLFKEMLRVVREISPPVFLLENVKGILSMDKGRVIKIIQKSFEDLGYVVKIQVLKASNYGVPQDRERVFMIGTKLSNTDLHPPIDTLKPLTVDDALSDLSFLNAGECSVVYKNKPLNEFQEKMRENASILHNHESAKHNDTVVKKFSLLKQGQTGKNLPEEYRTKKMVLCRLDGKKPARTVTTLPDDYVHYKKNRILTVREMARLQSFPDDYIFFGPRTTGGARRKLEIPQYSQIGNAVPPLLARKVGSHLINHLKNYHNA